MIRRILPLLLLHLPANALLLWLAYQWLGVDESTVARLVFSAAAALLLLAAACWLHGAAMVWFSSPEPALRASFRSALRHLGALVALAVVSLALYGLAAKAAEASAPAALKTASWLTWTLRTPVKPSAVAAAFGVVFWLMRWAVLPVLLLPAAAESATRGFAGWQRIFGRRSWRQWVAIPLLALIGFRLPPVILGWKPEFASFGMELTSFIARALVAYLLVVGALLGLSRSACAAHVAGRAEAHPTLAGR